MKKAALMAALLLTAEAFGGNILFYRDIRNCRIEGGIVSGTPLRVECTTPGSPLLLFPREHLFDTGEAAYFGMMVRAPGKERIRLEVVFHGPDGGSRMEKVDSEVRDNWRQISFKLDRWKKELREKGIVKIEIRFPEPGVFLFDDLRFIGKEISREVPLLPPLTSGTFFPEYVEPREIAGCLEDPLYRKKLAEIDRMRRGDPLRQFGKGEISPECTAFWQEIQPDGSITGLAPEIIRRFERDTRSHRSEHEGFSRQTAPRLSAMLRAWRQGTIERSAENQQKLIKALNYYMICEANRRGEADRWVTVAFWYTRIAAESYLMFLDEMEAVESGNSSDPDLTLLNRLTKVLAANAFSEPLANLPAPPLTLESFRHHPCWIGGNFGYRPLYLTALVCRNPLMLDVCVEVVKNGLSVTSFNTRKEAFWPEGFTADGAGWGHGEQNYLFRYPADGIRGMTALLAELKGSLWSADIAKEQYQLILEYLRTALWYSYAPAQYGPTLLISERECMRYNKDAGYFTFKPMLTIAEKLKTALPDDMQDELKELLEIATGKAPEFEGCRYFWNNDDLLNRRRDYFIGVNMVSARTLGCESAPLASSKIDFLADGATLLMKRPSTYTVAKGFWQPAAIPGVTARQFDFDHKGNQWRTYRGLFNLAGGVSDGEFGVCGFRYGKQPLRHVPDRRFYKVQAYKSYFCFEDELVCLGAGIGDLDPVPGLPVRTTLDQTEWLFPCEYLLDGKSPKEASPGNDFQAKGDSLLLAHGGIGYLSLAPGRFFISGEKRPERWLEYHVAYNSKQPERPAEADILMLQADHGEQASDGAYAYLVHMRTPDLAALRKYNEQLPVTILSNTPALQAVRHRTLKTTQAVFFDPSQVLDDGKRIWKINIPAALMIREHANSIEITVSDLLQNSEGGQAVLTVSKPFRGRSRFEIPLPGNPFAGKPAPMEFPDNSSAVH